MALALHFLRVLEARVRVADRRAHRDVGHRRIELRRLGQRNRVVARVARAHAQELGDMAAAGASVDADLRRVAVPRGRFPFEPAHPVVRVLQRKPGTALPAPASCRWRPRARRWPRARGPSVPPRDGPCAFHAPPCRSSTVGNGPAPCRLIDAGHQHSPGWSTPDIDLAHLDLEPGLAIVCRLRMHQDRQADCAQCGHLPEKGTASGRIVVHADLLAGTLSDTCRGSGKRRMAVTQTRVISWQCQGRFHGNAADPS